MSQNDDGIDDVLAAMGTNEEQIIKEQRDKRNSLASAMDDIAFDEVSLLEEHNSLPVEQEDISINILDEEVDDKIDFDSNESNFETTTIEQITKETSVQTPAVKEKENILEEQETEVPVVKEDQIAAMISLRESLASKLKLFVPYTKQDVTLVPISVNVTDEYKQKTPDLSMDFPDYNSVEYNIESINLGIEMAKLVQEQGEEAVTETIAEDFNSSVEFLSAASNNGLISSIDDRVPEEDEIAATKTGEKKWVDEVPIPNERRVIKISKPSKASLKKNATTPEAKMQLFSRTLGVGGRSTTPLWASGFWISFEPIPISDIAINHTMLIENSERLGRRTSGYGYDTFNVLAHKQNIMMFLKHVGSCTIKDKSVENLLENISVFDIETLYAAALENMYPSGFKIIRRCINHKCEKERALLVNPGKLIKWDWAMLPDEAIRHISAIGDVHDNDSIKKYRESMEFNKEHSFIINKQEDVNGNIEFVRITLSPPSLKKYFDFAESYIFELEKTVNETYLAAATPEERNSHIFRFSQVYMLRAFSHWISKVENVELDVSTNVEEVIVSATTDDEIKKVSAILSNDVDLVDTIIAEIRKYHATHSYSSFGIWRHTCRHCDYDQGHGLDDNSYIIPLDIVETFFHLEELRLQKAQAL